MTGGRKEYWFGKKYMHVGGKQYWVYGKGFYSAWGEKTNSLMVMRDGKEIGLLKDVKDRLKKILEGKLSEEVLVEE